MISMNSPALMLTKNDIEQLLDEWSQVTPWVRSHLSAKHPPHRYEGDLLIEDQCLVFRGRDIKEGRAFEEVIPLDSIIEVAIGFDERLKGSTDFSFGNGGPVPFTVCYQSEAGEQTAYFTTYLNHYPIHIINGNRKWYETLKNITRRTARRELKAEKELALVTAGV